MFGLGPASPYPAVEPLPFTGPSVQAFGDMHQTKNAAATANVAAAAADSKRLASPTLFVQMGDMTHSNLTAEHATAKGIIDGLTAPVKRIVGGNHDLNYGTPQGGEAACAQWGYNTARWTFDLGPVLCIGITPESSTQTSLAGQFPYVTLSSADLAWLDAQLTAATKPCWVFFHAPLQSPDFDYTTGFWAEPQAGIATLAAAHANLAAWISGHIHWPLESGGTFNRVPCGSRLVPNVNASATANVVTQPAGDIPEASDPVKSIFLQPHDDGSITRWIRDHRLGAWNSWPGGVAAQTLVAT